MTSPNGADDRVLQVLLEEYRIMWEEARTLKRNMFGTAGVIATVLIGGIAAGAQLGYSEGSHPDIVTVLLIGTPYVAILGLFALTWFFRHIGIVDGYLAIVELKINSSVDKRVLIYQNVLGEVFWRGALVGPLTEGSMRVFSLLVPRRGINPTIALLFVFFLYVAAGLLYASFIVCSLALLNNGPMLWIHYACQLILLIIVFWLFIQGVLERRYFSIRKPNLDTLSHL